MRRFASFLLATLAVFGWLTFPQTALAKLKVVATTPDIAAIAQAVGADQVEITTLVRPTEDPHFIDPKPSFVVKLNRADALIEGGAELEAGWLPPLLQRAGNPRLSTGAPGRIQANKGIEMMDVPAALDRSKGDIHPSGNPHFLIDPLNAVSFAGNLAEAFGRIDPPNAAVYRANAEKFAAEIKAGMERWKKAFEPFKGETVVGYHNSWVYFGRRFGLKIDLFLEPKPGLPPSPGHLAQVIEQMKTRKTRVIIVDRYLDRRTAEAVASRTGAKTVEVSHYPGGVKGTEGGYIQLMDYLVKSISAALAGQP